MQRALLFVVCLIIFSGLVFGQGTASEKFVKAYSEKKNGWLTSNKVDSIKALLDTRCLYIHSNGWVQKADEVIADMQSGKLVYKKIAVSDLVARQFEDVVIVTGRGRFEGSVDSKPFDMQLAFTEVYMRRKAGWKLISRHSNKLE